MPDGPIASEGDPKTEQRFNGTVRYLMASDLPHLRPILETWIRFPTITGQSLPEEVAETLREMNDSLSGKNMRQFFVAQSPEGKILGVMGMQPLGPKMQRFAHSQHSAEIINAYVHLEERQGKGVGKALVTSIEDEASNRGYEELLLNSGPRYKETGWPFWKKMYGEPVGILRNHYGPGNDAPVWRKTLR